MTFPAGPLPRVRPAPRRSASHPPPRAQCVQSWKPSTRSLWPACAHPPTDARTHTHTHTHTASPPPSSCLLCVLVADDFASLLDRPCPTRAHAGQPCSHGISANGAEESGPSHILLCGAEESGPSHILLWRSHIQAQSGLSSISESTHKWASIPFVGMFDK